MHQAYDRCKKVKRCNLIETGRIKHRNWPFEDTISVFWGEFRRPLAALDRWPLNKGAFAFKIVRGALKWPLRGGSRLIEVAETPGLTVVFIFILLLKIVNFGKVCTVCNEIGDLLDFQN